MFDTELNSFVVKFQQLRSAGRNAHLDLHSEGGQCFVSLRVQLGEAGQQPHHRHQQVRRGLRRSPAYHRRQVRRKAAREAAGTSSSADRVSDEAPAEEVSAESQKSVNEAAEASSSSTEKNLGSVKCSSDANTPDTQFEFNGNYAYIGGAGTPDGNYAIGTLEGIIIETIASIEAIDNSKGSDFYNRELKCKHCKCWCSEKYFYEHQCFSQDSWFHHEMKARLQGGAAAVTAICSL